MLLHYNTYEMNLNMVLYGLHYCAVCIPHYATYFVQSSVFISCVLLARAVPKSGTV